MRKLKHIREGDAPGVNAIHKAMDRLPEEHNVLEFEHEQIISKLNECARFFRIVVLKSTLTIPYTSVFLELEGGYWSGEAKCAVRRRMRLS